MKNLILRAIETQKLLFLQVNSSLICMGNEIIIFPPDSSIAFEVRVEDENVWRNRNQIAVIYDHDVNLLFTY